MLELELRDAGSFEPVERRARAVEEALTRVRDRVAAGDDLPWSAYDLAKLSLLAGASDDALSAACLAVARSTAAFMVATSLRSLDLIAGVAPDLDGLGVTIEVLRLGLAARFEEPAAAATGGFAEPVVILAGGSSTAADRAVQRYADVLREAARGLGGTLISGGTTQGVSALAGLLAADANTGCVAIGYVPAVLPGDVALDSGRYFEIRHTDGKTFSLAEPLRYWRDLLEAGVPAARVRLVAIGGGRVSAQEFRLALSLGAQVGVMQGSGGTATGLLRDPPWATSPRLEELPPTAAALAAFLGRG